MSVELGRQKIHIQFLWENFLGTEKTILCGSMSRKNVAHDEVQYHSVISALLNFTIVRHSVRLYRQLFIRSVKRFSVAWLPLHQALRNKTCYPTLQLVMRGMLMYCVR